MDWYIVRIQTDNCFATYELMAESGDDAQKIAEYIFDKGAVNGRLFGAEKKDMLIMKKETA